MIKAENLYKSFGALEVLHDISLEVKQGEIVSIVGPSGAGKTTLLQILGSLDRPDRGTVRLGGVEFTALGDDDLARFRGKHIGFIFQFHQLLPEFTALENVMMPAWIGGEKGKNVQERAAELLERLGLKDRMGHKPSELSGGECQRVAVGRALMNRPDVVFADEPTGSLDSHNKAEMSEIFFRLREELGQTFVIVTHDEDLARAADRIIHLTDGRVAQ